MLPLLSHPRIHLFGTAVYLCLSLVTGARPAVAQDSGRAAAAMEYRSLVDQYAAGDTERAAAALAEHDTAWIERSLTAVEREARSWSAARVQAAILLHTDAVVDGWVLPSRVALNLAASRRLADMAGEGRLPAPFRRDWLLVVTWYLLSELDLASMPPWLDLMQSRFGTDADVQRTLGAFFEALGWNEDMPAPFPWDARVLRMLRERSAREALQQAAAAYRRVLVMAPGDDAARVRLGRTLVQLRHYDEAVQFVAPVHDRPGDRVWPYLSWLVTAAARTGQGRLEEAARAYERAAALLPSCQTPLVGLSAVRRLQGRVLESAVAAERLATEPGACNDPWSFYRFGEPPDVRARLLIDLRRRVATP